MRTTQPEADPAPHASREAGAGAPFDGATPAPTGGGGVVGSLPHPPLARRSMTPRPWALTRVGRRRHDYPPIGPAPAPRDAPRLWRRALLMLLVLAGAALGTHAMLDVLPERGATGAEKALLVLYGVLFAWISAGFWTAVMGAGVLLRRQPWRRKGTSPAGHREPVRTAIVMPICNEDVPTVFGGLQATIESLAAAGSTDGYDFFVLSDTNEADVRVAEQAAWSALAAHVATLGVPTLQVHYRWRTRRTKRKAGNVADFCRRWGGAYRYLIVLDADSVMSGACITALVDAMEDDPSSGLIQTPPRPWGHTTLHARIQQFSARVYGPLFTAGMHFWQLGESHYWGHNAILRMKPFVEHCALAPLPGRGALGGEIISHDFVEAALMRRAGYRVWVAHDLAGSYEQVPPNLLAELQRDRRWCQGNLQNSRLTFEPGLHAVHRATFVTGVLAYVSAPLWLAFLLISTLLFTREVARVPTYFVEPYQLFPLWPTANLKLMLTLFGLTAFLLLAPKLVSLLLIILRGRAVRYGGGVRLVLSALLEFLHSLLLAPVRMFFHSVFVVATLTGWRFEWKSPPRNATATGWGEAFRRHGVHALVAVAWVAAIVWTSGTFQWWLTPVIVGLIAAIPVSVWTSRTRPGEWLRRHRLLLTPEEADPPPVLQAAARYHAELDAKPQPTFVDAVHDAGVLARVLDALPDRPAAAGLKGRALAERVERATHEGVDALGDDDRLRLLSDAASMRRLLDVAPRSGPPALPARRPADDAAAASSDAEAAEPASIGAPALAQRSS
ncbi:glucans biosynthesis glucosyltransferase MdoH [Piscinibacter koreensis]|uniref:Glucans biosynthesis glucosyltransferase H n=1 Tax=Piscinibacter koreensis TaxID=2742824 RepID=A0A7Y6NND1_9BURK|nr:glucans biosynthesis glucosyltransferase MdoH [Schlegelella koreensis]NUZ06262.1 glucans biosynthesis glucosyltransferase MdoH [Schlegelella koreensis]